MIKINLQNIDKLAEAHYQQLKDDLISKIDSGKNFVPKTKTTKVSMVDLETSHKDWLKKNLRDILTGKPNELIDLYDISESSFPNINYKKVFDYDWFSSKQKEGYDSYKLAKSLNIRTCCYCNRNYTNTVISSNDKITRPQFDHFYYQKKYSILALSFYNLIPSCNICNSNLKGQKDYNLIHPYVDDFISTFRFKSIPQNITTLLNVNDEFDFEIEKLSSNNVINEKIDTSIKLFKLKEIYASHGNEIQDLYKLRYKYSKTYLEELSKMTKNKFSKEELFRLAFGTEIEESKFSNRPLSKMKKDILIELGIIM